MRSQLAGIGFDDAVVQNFGTASDVLIRLAPQGDTAGEKIREQVLDALQAGDSDVDLRRVEFVGPQVGKELAETGALAMMIAIIMILIYVAFRFQWKFSMGAVAALVQRDRKTGCGDESGHAIGDVGPALHGGALGLTRQPDESTGRGGDEVRSRLVRAHPPL